MVIFDQRVHSSLVFGVRCAVFTVHGPWSPIFICHFSFISDFNANRSTQYYRIRLGRTKRWTSQEQHSDVSALHSYLPPSDLPTYGQGPPTVTASYPKQFRKRKGNGMVGVGLLEDFKGSARKVYFKKILSEKALYSVHCTRFARWRKKIQ